MAKKRKKVKKPAKKPARKLGGRKKSDAKKRGTKRATGSQPRRKKTLSKSGKKKLKKTKVKAARKKPIARKKAVALKKPKKKVVKRKPVKRLAKKLAKKISKEPVIKAPVQNKTEQALVVKKEVLIEPTVVQQDAGHSEHRESFIPHVTGLKAGAAAPYFSGTDQNGNVVSLNDFYGKTLVLYFYPKDDTDGCTAESCSLRDEYPYLTGHNYAVVGVSADDIESHKKFAGKYLLPFSLIADTNMEIIRAYDVWGKKRLFDHIYDGIVRTTFLIKDGMIERVITSVNSKNHGKQVMEG